MAVYTAIIKAKAVLSEAKHLGILENKDDPMGEEVKLKRPKKNPKEEKIKNPVATDDTSSGYGHIGEKQYFGKADKTTILAAIDNIVKEINEWGEESNPFLDAERRVTDQERRETNTSEIQRLGDALSELEEGTSEYDAVLSDLQATLDDMAEQSGAGDTDAGQMPFDGEDTWKATLQEGRK